MSEVYYVHIRTIGRRKGIKPIPRMPIGTLAVQKLEDGRIKIAGAMCSGDDNFCYKTGRDKAKGQLAAQKDAHCDVFEAAELISIRLIDIMHRINLVTQRFLYLWSDNRIDEEPSMRHLVAIAQPTPKKAKA